MKDKDGLLSWMAVDELHSLRLAHVTAKTAIQLIATEVDLRPRIQALLQTNSGFAKGATDSAYSDSADITVRTAQEIIDNDFMNLRTSMLIGQCAALEHLIKCLIVEWAEIAPQKIEGLDSFRISLQASDFLEADLRDRLFLVADKLYQDTPSNKGHSEKFRSIVRNHIPHQFELFQREIEAVDKDDLDEAFLVRNCVIHNGAKINRQLARLDGFELGGSIVISSRLLGKYSKAIEKMGGALFSCSAACVL